MNYPQEKRVLKVIQFVAKEGRLDRRRFREIGRLLVKGMDKGVIRVPPQVFSDFLPPEALQAAFDYYKAKMARRCDPSYRAHQLRPSNGHPARTA